MNLIREVNESDIPLGVDKPDVSGWGTREAVRAVVRNQTGQVYLLNVTRHGYHKLAGGGIDPGESHDTALARELMEELGVTAKQGQEIGKIIEYKGGGHEVVQTSYCYLAEQFGGQVAQSLEPGELAEGHDIVLADDIDHAIAVMQADTPANYEGQFIQVRDTAFLEAGRQILRSI